MPEFRPVETIEDHRTLDESEVLIGYMDGVDGLPEPGSDCSRSHMHGWRNGMIETGRMEPDRAYEALAQAFRSMTRNPEHMLQ